MMVATQRNSRFTPSSKVWCIHGNRHEESLQLVVRHVAVAVGLWPAHAGVSTPKSAVVVSRRKLYVQIQHGQEPHRLLLDLQVLALGQVILIKLYPCTAPAIRTVPKDASQYHIICTCTCPNGNCWSMVGVLANHDAHQSSTICWTAQPYDSWL